MMSARRTEMINQMEAMGGAWRTDTGGSRNLYFDTEWIIAQLGLNLDDPESIHPTYTLDGERIDLSFQDFISIAKTLREGPVYFEVNSGDIVSHADWDMINEKIGRDFHTLTTTIRSQAEHAATHGPTAREHLVMVLADGETFSELAGCRIVRIPISGDDETISQALDDLNNGSQHVAHSFHCNFCF